MKLSTHTHRLALSWWIGYILLGSFILLIAFSTLALNLQDLFFGDTSSLLATEISILLLMPAGFFLLAYPFTTSVVAGPQGLEYHTISFVLAVRWDGVRAVGTTKNLALVPLDGTLTLQGWAKPLSRIFRSSAQQVQICVSHFGACNGHSLREEALRYTSQD